MSDNKSWAEPWKIKMVEHLRMTTKEERIVAMMKKYKSDVLTDGGYLNFYTRTASGLTPVSHEKFQQYREDDAFKELVNDGFEEQI